LIWRILCKLLTYKKKILQQNFKLKSNLKIIQLIKDSITQDYIAIKQRVAKDLKC
jgi:hypothetical protein